MVLEFKLISNKLVESQLTQYDFTCFTSKKAAFHRHLFEFQISVKLTSYANIEE